MRQPYEDYFERLQTILRSMIRTVENLHMEDLDWCPGPDTNSLSVLVVHVAGATRYWIGDVVGDSPSGRVREAEFQVHGLDAFALVEHLEDALAHSRGVLESLQPTDMEALRRSPRDGREVTVGWALLHALEHAAQHLGHMDFTRQLMETRVVTSKNSKKS